MEMIPIDLEIPRVSIRQNFELCPQSVDIYLFIIHPNKMLSTLYALDFVSRLISHIPGVSL